jgi:hypothetical protein
MKRLWALAVALLSFMVLPAPAGIAGEIIADEGEDDASLYMLQLTGAENIASTASKSFLTKGTFCLMVRMRFWTSLRFGPRALVRFSKPVEIKLHLPASCKEGRC